MPRCRPASARVAALAAALTLAAALHAPLAAQERAAESAERSTPGRCAAGITEEEARGYVPLPRGDVFCPLLADPKGLRSFVSYLRGDAAEFATDVASVGISDEFGLVRFGGTQAGDGVQISLGGGVFAQFDLGTSSYDLINADYVISLPVTVRRSGFSARLRAYHQSSHLGDEFLLRANRPDRENLSFEALDVLLSQDVSALRLYAGGEYYVNREPRSLPLKIGHAGAELRPRASVRFGNVGTARLVAAVDVKAVAGSGWETGVSARGGVEVGRAREGTVPSRRWSLLYEYYDGPSPYGQFFQDHVRLMGVGFHFSL